MYQTILKRCFHVLVFLSISASLVAEIPAGYYYFSQHKKGADLKTSLAENSAPLYVLSYGGGKAGFTWEGFSKVDKHANGSVWDMYSDSVRYFDDYNAVSGMHIEHSLPKSWWGGYVNNAYRDLFHLYPADGITNSTKNDLPLGEITTATFDNGVSKIGLNIFGSTYTGRCFEPADEYKGDFARSYFYVSTIYENFESLWQSPMMDNNTYPVWQSWALELLMKWHLQDPVSEKELARNEAIYAIQSNRNPFIDYPDLVTYIWGDSVSQEYPFPVETKAFLLYPRAGKSVDFGVILQNNTISEVLDLRGVNLTGDISLALAQGSQFLLPVNSLSQAAAEAGTTFTINFVPTTSGTMRDTLIITGGETDTLRIPLEALAAKEFMTLEPVDETPVGGTLQWISDADATDYKISIYQGDTAAGDLLISSYVEGSNYNKAIEIFNGTGKAVDLSSYSLRKQSNGQGSFSVVYKLSGTLSNKSTYVLVHSSCSNADLRAKANTFTDSLMNFDGNDAIALYRNGLMIDVAGYADDGGTNYWGRDCTLIRQSAVTHPRMQYDETEWISCPQDMFDSLGTHTIDLVSSVEYLLLNHSVGTQNTYTVSNLEPEKVYTYSVKAILPSGNKRTVNTSQLHTTGLDAPMAMEATDVTYQAFTANWEETPYATGYLLDVYTLSGSGYSTDSINFDSVGSNGKPLPDNWTGTASGNYTNTANSGLSPNALALKNNGEYVQTAEYETPISQLSFMYRFPSSGTGNILAIDVLCDGSWQNLDSIRYVNTAKYYPQYTFTTQQNVQAFKFTFFKAKGNLALDDISITYGKLDTIYVVKNKKITTNSCIINEVDSNKTYYYAVRATRGTSVSAGSEVKQVLTVGVATKINEPTSTIRLLSGREIFRLTGLQPQDQVSIYALSGICLYRQQTNASELDLPALQSGIYLIQIQNNKAALTLKVIR